MENLKRPDHRLRGFAPERICSLVLLAGVLALLLILLSMETRAARWPLSIDATPNTFHWEPGYACCFSAKGPAATLGNLSLHLVPGLYGGKEERGATVAVYDALPDRSRVFRASGYQFEARLCGNSFFILNWTGTMGEEELTLIKLKLKREAGRWRIGKIFLTRYDTRRHSSLDDLAPCGGREEE